MGRTAKFGNVALPGASFFERSGPFTKGGCRAQHVYDLSSNSDSVAMLGIGASPSYDPGELQSVINKVDELITVLRR